MCAAVQRHYTFLVNALIFGLTYFMVTCATRHHNGAHLNPVITIASMLAGVCGAVQALVFIVVQVWLTFSCLSCLGCLALVPDMTRPVSAYLLLRTCACFGFNSSYLEPPCHYVGMHLSLKALWSRARVKRELSDDLHSVENVLSVLVGAAVATAALCSKMNVFIFTVSALSGAGRNHCVCNCSGADRERQTR